MTKKKTLHDSDALSPALKRVIDALQSDGDSLIGSEEIEQWTAALTAAGPAAYETLVKYGAVSAEDGFFRCVRLVANAGWKYEERSTAWQRLLQDTVRTRARISISDEAGRVEDAKWQGAYALGVAVGLLLAGGAR